MTTLSKYEVNAMAQKAGCAWLHEPLAQRFATLCRVPLVAEVERLKQAHEINAGTLNAMQVEIDDWKARALKSEQVGDRAVPDAEDYDLIDRYLRNNLDDADYGEYLAALDRLVTPQPAAQEPVLWQYRWTNPSGDPYQESQMDWKQVKPTWNQTVQQNCDELLAYRFEGKPIYEVRALYATPPRPAAQEPVGVFVSDAEFGRIDLVPHHGAPMVDGQSVYATPPSAAPVVAQLVEALERKLPGGKQTDDFESSRIGDYNQGWNDYRKAVKKMFKNINMNSSENSNPDAYLYSLEYGEKVVDTKVSIHQLNYPFGVAGADYLVRNDDGVSYVRQTKLYADLSRALAAGQKFIKENGK